MGRVAALLAAVTVLVSLFTVTGAVDADRSAAIDRSGTCCTAAMRLEPPEAPSIDRVFLVGDSLSFHMTSPLAMGTGQTLQDRLTATGLDVTFDARKGRRLEEGIAVLRASAVEVAAADLVVVDLGTNNVWGLDAQSEAAARSAILEVTDVISELSPAARILWVDITVESVRARTLHFDRALDALAAEAAALDVCHWREAALANPSWMAADGIHYTGTGYRVRRDHVATCVSVVRSGGTP